MTKIYTERSNAVRAARKALGDTTSKAGVDFFIEAVDGGFVFSVPGPVEVIAEPVRPEDMDVEHPLSGGSDADLSAAIAADLDMMDEMDGDDVMPKADHDQLEIPASLKIPAEQRAAAWERNPPRPAPKMAAPKPAKVAKAKATDGGSKIAAVIEAAKSDTGVSVPMIHEMTGWKKIGGFFTAAKRAGLTLKRERADGVTVYRAA